MDHFDFYQMQSDIVEIDMGSSSYSETFFRNRNIIKSCNEIKKQQDID